MYVVLGSGVLFLFEKIPKNRSKVRNRWDFASTDGAYGWVLLLCIKIGT